MPASQRGRTGYVSGLFPVRRSFLSMHPAAPPAMLRRQILASTWVMTNADVFAASCRAYRDCKEQWVRKNSLPFGGLIACHRNFLDEGITLKYGFTDQRAKRSPNEGRKVVVWLDLFFSGRLRQQCVRSDRIVLPNSASFWDFGIPDMPVRIIQTGQGKKELCY
jgi:hypothetical protein